MQIHAGTGPVHGAADSDAWRQTGARSGCLYGLQFDRPFALALPPDGRLIACDRSEEFTSIAKRYWAEAGVAGKIDLHLAPALDTLDALIAAGGAGTFDFAFIDADKTNYANYYERCLTLLRVGGVVAVDNVLWAGRVCDHRGCRTPTPSRFGHSTKSSTAIRAWR